MKNEQVQLQPQVDRLKRMNILTSLFFSLEILFDDSIRRTFSVISFMPKYHKVQKVADKEVG